jgi:cell division protein ZapA (FtsZ GTPase activity inhibitor)
MSKLSVKVVIAGRTYPLTVSEGEEIKVQKAAEEINKSIQYLQDNYAVKDLQDLLAMASLQLVTKNTTVVASTENDCSEIEKELKSIVEGLKS